MSTTQAPASSTKAKLRFLEELTYKNLPAAPIFQETRFNSDTVAHEVATSVSQEITENATISDIVREGIKAAGVTTHELSYGAQDRLIRGALFEATMPTGALTVDQTTVDVSLLTADNSINTAGGNFVAGGYLPDRWIIVYNVTNSALIGVAKIVSVATNKMILSHINIAADIPAGDSIRVAMPEVMGNGTTCTSFGLETEYGLAAAADNFKYISGAIPAGMELGFTNEGRLTLQFTWLGAEETNPGATASTGGAPIAVPNNKTLSVVDHLKVVQRDGTIRKVTGVTLNVSANLKEIKDAGELTLSNVLQGKFKVSGSVSSWYRDTIEYAKYLAHTDSGISYTFMTPALNGYIVEVAALNYVSGGRPVEGDEPVELSLGFEAKQHATQGFVVRIYPFAL